MTFKRYMSTIKEIQAEKRECAVSMTFKRYEHNQRYTVCRVNDIQETYEHNQRDSSRRRERFERRTHRAQSMIFKKYMSTIREIQAG